MTPDEIINRHSKLYELFAGVPVDQAVKITRFFDEELALSTIKSRIQERKDCIYILEQDMMDDESFKLYSEDYIKCMKDEIENHREHIAELESELLAFQ